MLGAHLFGLLNVSQIGLEPVSGGGRALLFSQCNVAWRCFLCVKVLILLDVLLMSSVAPVSQQGFAVMELMLSAFVP
jgi:hypothetical protein